jgi:5,6,7,8-tetrahydromethanopterin hydro-lyase
VRAAERLDGRIGEAWAGEVPNGIHVNVVLARRASAAAGAAVGALAAPSPGHVPFLAALEGGRMIRPATIVVNKTTLESETLERLTWGATQLGIAQGVLDRVADGVLPAGEAADLVVLVVVWVDPDANDETAVRAAAREATAGAIADAAQPPGAEAVEQLAARREGGSNRYYGGA